MQEAVIVSSARTPVGSFGGSLKTVSAIDLGALAIHEAVKRAGLRPVVSDGMKTAAPDALKDQGRIDLESKQNDWDDNATPVVVDEVIMGNVLLAGQGQNPGRQAMIRAGIPKETPAFTINKVCASGLKSIALGASAIMCGEADVIIAGGQESMSSAPMALPNARWGHRMEVTGKGDVYDLMVYDGLYEIFYGYHGGDRGKYCGKISDFREEQDELSLLSHNRARAAIADGTFAREIVPVVISGRKGDVTVDTDERPMKPAWKKWPNCGRCLRKTARSPRAMPPASMTAPPPW
ncbi:MAG: beta-ketoacyl synthase N-terminal-like domain-containing protein [Desulfobacterales bacterium]